MPAGTTLGHVHLHVSNLEQAARFYSEVIGFDRVGNFGDQATFLSAGGYHHHIGINTWAGVGAPQPNESTTGLRWFSVVLSDHEEMKAVKARLEASGAELDIHPNHLTTSDPAGNGVRLVVEGSIS